jgi:DNA-binding transcriptional regulator YhcF (GntR family)
MAKWKTSPPKARPASRGKTKAKSSGGKMPAHEALLSATMQACAMMGTDTPDRKKVALLAGMVNKNTVAGAFSKLAQSGLIEYPDKETVRLTDAGKQKAGSNHHPLATTNKDIQETLRSMLKGGKPVEVFDLLTDGQSYDRDELAALVGIPNPKSSTLAGSLSNLRTLGLLDDVTADGGAKLVRLSKMAFPFGRPGSSGTQTDTESVRSV